MKFERKKLFTLVRMDNYSKWEKKTKQQKIPLYAKLETNITKSSY
jgi:hypothetical protein